jgi:multiple sugar transport system permease protein
MVGNLKLKSLIKYFEIVFIIIITLISFIPFLWLILTSFKFRTDILSPVLKLFFNPTLSNYTKAFVEGEFSTYFLNSLTIATGNVILCLFIGLPAAYAFSRFKVFGEKHIFFYVLSTRMAPAIALVLPLYMFFKQIGILGTTAAVIIAHATFNLALVIYLMKNFFNDIPKEIDEAALVDGASEFDIFLKIVLPNAKSGVIVVAIITFLFSWNEFLFTLLIGGSNTTTLTAAFPGLVTPLGTYWGQLAAVSVVVSLPVIISVWYLQKHLVRGLTFGAVK